MNFENSISLNFPAIMLETLETLKRFKSFMKLYNPTRNPTYYCIAPYTYFNYK